MQKCGDIGGGNIDWLVASLEAQKLLIKVGKNSTFRRFPLYPIIFKSGGYPVYARALLKSAQILKNVSFKGSSINYVITFGGLGRPPPYVIS